jgi:hypothetical protein
MLVLLYFPDFASGITIKSAADTYSGTTYLQGCAKLVNRNNITYLIYANNSADYYYAYIKTYNHRTHLFSNPVYLGYDRRDHTYPCIVMTDDGYLHAFWGTRPNTLKYRRSAFPESILMWNKTIPGGSSATYPMALAHHNDIFAVFREGDSYRALLQLAVIPKNEPWPKHLRTEDITTLSDKFIAIPADTFIYNDRTCFIFSFRVKAFSFGPFPDSRNVSTKESMSAVCRASDGKYYDLDNKAITLPLDYARDIYSFPRLIKETSLNYTSQHSANNSVYFTNITYDDSVMEFNVTKYDNNISYVVFSQGKVNTAAVVLFTDDGKIGATSGPVLIPLKNYSLGQQYRIRIKVYPSKQVYRIWINGISYEPYPLYFHQYPRFNISRITDITASKDVFGFKVQQDYSPVFISSCFDKYNYLNIFFSNKKFAYGREYYSLMHWRKNVLKEIGNPIYDKYQVSCAADNSQIYVLTEYFTNYSGHYETVSSSPGASEIYLLSSSDYSNYEETKITNGYYAQIHPAFKKPDSSHLLEFVWTDNSPRPTLKYGFFNKTAFIQPDPTPRPQSQRPEKE